MAEPADKTVDIEQLRRRLREVDRAVGHVTFRLTLELRKRYVAAVRRGVKVVDDMFKSWKERSVTR